MPRPCRASQHLGREGKLLLHFYVVLFVAPQRKKETSSCDGGRGLVCYCSQTIMCCSTAKGAGSDIKGCLPCASQPGELVGCRAAVWGHELHHATMLGSSSLASGSSSPGQREIATVQWGQISNTVCRDEAEEMAPSGLTQAILTGQNHRDKMPAELL